LRGFALSVGLYSIPRLVLNPAPLFGPIECPIISRYNARKVTANKKPAFYGGLYCENYGGLLSRILSRVSFALHVVADIGGGI
jgi:hypothetical protein